VVVVDEAHNLIEAINAAYTAHLTLTQVHTTHTVY
jgi:Rad3-related DNA helicase